MPTIGVKEVRSAECNASRILASPTSFSETAVMGRE
jgi:hypothetical protein